MNTALRTDSKSESGPTFLIKVIYTQNASMQGYINWLEKEKALPFRSCLELFHLMEKAIEIAHREEKGKVRFRSWE